MPGSYKFSLQATIDPHMFSMGSGHYAVLPIVVRMGNIYSHGAGIFVSLGLVSLNTGRGTGTETCWWNNVFPPDDLWCNSDT